MAKICSTVSGRVNMRKTPAIDNRYKIVAYLHAGDQLTVHSTGQGDGTWSYCTYGENVGYIKSEFICG